MLLSFLILVFNCTPQPISATWQNWIGGIPEEGGVIYNITVTSTKCDEIILDSLIIDGKRIPLRIQRKPNQLLIQGKESRSGDSYNDLDIDTGTTKLRKDHPLSCTVYYHNGLSGDSLSITSFKKEKDIYYQ